MEKTNGQIKKPKSYVEITDETLSDYFSRMQSAEVSSTLDQAIRAGKLMAIEIFGAPEYTSDMAKDNDGIHAFNSRMRAELGVDSSVHDIIRSGRQTLLRFKVSKAPDAAPPIASPEL